MVFSDLAAGFFRRNARSEGAAEGGVWGEFRRARARQLINFGGPEETRTPDILLAKQALYQLSYGPAH